MANKSIVITVLGFAGFIFACFLFFYNSGDTKSLFHEIKYDPNIVARTMLKEKRDSVSNKIDIEIKLRHSLTEKIEKKDNELERDRRDSIQRILDIDTPLLKAINNYYTLSDFEDSTLYKAAESNLKSSVNLDWLFHFNTLYSDGYFDTLYSGVHFDTLYSGGRIDTILSTDTSFKKIPLSFTFYDRGPDIEKIGEIYKTVPLPIYNFYSDVDFFSKYPAFGVWAFLIILFCCCFAMTIGYCIYSGNELSVLIVGKKCEGTLSYWKSFWICFLFLVFFVATIYFTFYDSSAIKSLYFMKGLSTRIIIISILGYTTAAFCFAGMISTASYAEYFKDKFQKQASLNEEIVRLTKSLENADPGSKTDIENQLQTKNKELKDFQMIIDNRETDYTNLRQLFRRFFYAIALLLALLVFCIGTLYSAVDSLDFMKMIKNDIGFSPSRHEFVYLSGALHTLLILLFYLPAQMQVARFKVKSTEPSAEEETKKGLLKGIGLGGQLKSISDVLLIGAPILASFAQWLLNMFFEN